MSDPKKHHFVPQLLLRNFVGADGRLVAFRVDRESTFAASPRDLGHVKDGHTRVRMDGSIDRASLEREMSDLEGEAATAIRRLEADRRLEVPAEEFAEIAWLASLQYRRNRFVLGYLRRALELRAEVSRAGDRLDFNELEIMTGILDVSVGTMLSAWHASKDPSARYKDQADYVANYLQSLRWDVLRYDRPCLLIGDTFAAQYGIAAQHSSKYPPVIHRYARHGLEVPLHEAASVTIPLSPYLALHLHEGSGRKYLSSQRVNQRTVYGARSFVAMPSDWSLPDSRVGDLDDWLFTQRFVRPVIARNV